PRSGEAACPDPPSPPAGETRPARVASARPRWRKDRALVSMQRAVCRRQRKNDRSPQPTAYCILPSLLILWLVRIQILVPQQNPAGHALHILDARILQDLGELHRSRAAAAMHDHFLVLV